MKRIWGMYSNKTVPLTRKQTQKSSTLEYNNLQ